jgi:hypothetical protein
MGFIACVMASALIVTLLIILMGWAGRRRRAKSRGPVTLHCFRP